MNNRTEVITMIATIGGTALFSALRKLAFPGASGACNNEANDILSSGGGFDNCMNNSRYPIKRNRCESLLAQLAGY